MLRASNQTVIAYFKAIKNLRIRQVSLVLKAGYDPNLMINARGHNGLQFMVNYFGATEAHYRLQVPINKAAYLSIAKLLLDSGLNANAIDLANGAEPIIFAAIRFDDVDIVAVLMHYADFSIRDKNGETAVMCAARFGSKPVMRMILEHLRHLDMDVYFLRQRNRFGFTALDLARAENLDCARVLTKHLIHFGVSADAVLSKSTSHHQLLEAVGALPRVVPNRRGISGGAGGHPQRTRLSAAAAAAAGLLESDSGSDYDSDVAPAGVVLGGATSGRLYAGSSQSQRSRVGAGDNFGHYLGDSHATSDDEANNEALFGARQSGYGAVGSSLSRSRSCAGLNVAGVGGSSGGNGSGGSGLSRGGYGRDGEVGVAGPSGGGGRNARQDAARNVASQAAGWQTDATLSGRTKIV